MLLGGLPAWFSAALGCPPPPYSLTADPAQALTGPGGGFGTHSKPPLTCLPTRQGKNRCFHHGHLCSLNFLPLELLPALVQWSTNRRAEPGRGPHGGAWLLVNAPLFPEETLCVPPLGLGPALLTSRPLPLVFGFVPVWPLSCLPFTLMDERHSPSLAGPAPWAGDLCLGPPAEKAPKLGLVLCSHCLEILNNF